MEIYKDYFTTKARQLQDGLCTKMICDMSKGVENLMLGIFILILSLFLWRITNNFDGWLFLFVSGSIFILMGLYRMFKDRFNE